MSDNNTEVDDFDIKYWISKVLGFWYLFVLAVVFSTGGAYLYLRYAQKTYRVSSSIIIADESSSNDLNLDVLSGLTGGRRSFGTSGLESEVSMIKSFDLVQATLKRLNFQVSIFTRGDLKDTEAFRNLPIEVNTIEFDNQTSQNIYFDFNGTQTFQVYLDVNSQKWSCDFGKPCLSDEFAFVVSIKDQEVFQKQTYPLFMKIYDFDRLTVQYINRLDVNTRNDISMGRLGSSIIDIEMAGRIVEKNTTFLNALVQAFIQYDLTERNSMANNTVAFINKQLSIITDSLISVENRLEDYRAAKGIIDLSSKGTLLLSQLTDLENRKAAIDLSLQYYDFLSDYLASPVATGQILSPSTAGIDDPALIALLGELNILISEKVGFTMLEGEKSFKLQSIDDQIASIKERVQENIRNTMSNSKLTYDQINGQLEKFRAQVSELPKNERDLLTIQRQFNINNELYTFLLKKKSETEIARAGNKPKVKVLNEARDLQAVFIGPISKKIYLKANAFGLIVVCGFLGMRFFFQNKISDIGQIMERGTVTVLGRVPHAKFKKKGGAALISPRDPLSEAFRSLRLNLDFIIPPKSTAKVIGVTSAESGEGKTFSALNLAQVFAVSGKKTVLLGLDLRKPKLQVEFELTHDIGLSNYFIGKANIDDVVQATGVQNLDVILSGPIPPNPAELIGGEKLPLLLENLAKQYDYIICDGPPVGLVTDYISAVPYMDTTLFVVRLKYSRLKSTELLYDYVSKGVVKSAHILINDVDKDNSKKYGYGYGYGYGVETKKKSNSFSRLFK